MKFETLHPRQQIIAIIDRIYRNGMTTTSGGNLSVLDADGSVWITPKGVDKGTLTPDDIVHVLKDGRSEGRHDPSSEFPFHKALYDARPDIRAVVHAHPPALVSFAITRRVPDTRIIPTVFALCGEIGYAEYALPGSMMLGAVVARTFRSGHDAVLMENHGIITVGATLLHAFHRLDALDFCAKLTLNAAILGGAVPVTNGGPVRTTETAMSEFSPDARTHSETDLRRSMIALLRRSCAQGLMRSTDGTMSARAGEGRFLITPSNADRNDIVEEDLVLIRDGMREKGKTPSRSAGLHRRIYEQHPDVNAVFIAQPPNILAFGVCGAEFDSRTIPESYLVLRTIPKLPYGAEKSGATAAADRISATTPVLICSNECVIVTGGSLIQGFDRLEVAEFSAKSIIASKAIGTVVPISDAQVAELEKAFDL